MRKLKLLFTGLAFFGGVFSANAQTDVTSTYLTNSDFEGSYTELYQIRNDGRYIYQPNGWTVDYKNESVWNMTVVASTDAMASNFTGTYAVPEDNQKYMVRFRDNKPSEYIDLSQTITVTQAGVYTFSADLIREDGSKVNVALYAGSNSVSNSTSNTWENRSVSVSLAANEEIKVGIRFTNLAADGKKLGADNIKITWTDPLKAAKDALQAEIDAVEGSDYATELASAIATAQDVLDNATSEEELTNAKIALHDEFLRCKNGLTEAAYNNPIVTSFVVNGTFDNSDISMWSCNNSFQNKGRKTSDDGNAGNMNASKPWWENWNGSSLVNKMYQTIEDIPNGTYRLDITAFVNKFDAESQYVFANNSQTPLTEDAKSGVNYEVYTVVTNNTIEVGFEQTTATANWMGIDNVSLSYYGAGDVINDAMNAGAKAEWQEAWNALDALDETALPDAAEAAITDALGAAEPTTVEGYNTATAVLQALIDSYDGIKAAYDEYKAIKVQVEDLKNTSKYTFTGDDALSAFNSALSDIDTEAEDATDAATLTALLPSLKAAGNAFVGGIDSNDGFDLTYNVVNNSFETGSLSPWTSNGSNDTGVRENSNGTYTTTGVDGDYLFNTWNNGAGSKVSQSVSGLPNGYYTVTALVASDAGNTIKILAGASIKTIDADGTNGKDLFVEGTTDKTLVSEGSLEIGANSSTWYKADNFRLTYYTVKAGAAEAWAAAKSAAEAARDNAAYVNVKGAEKTALLAEIAKAEPTTAEAYGTATTALQEATSAFIAAKDSYDALIAMRTTGATYTTVLWPRASAAKKTALDNAIAAEPTDAADAVTKTNAIVTAYRQFVESNGLAEGVDVAINNTSELLVTDASVSTDGWTSGSIGTNSGEGYTDGDGNVAGRYFDGGWSANAGVDITLTQNLTLPAGQYQLQITARGSDKLTSYTMSIGGESVDLPTESSTGGTFGRGWSDKYVIFESDGSELTLTIAAISTEYQQWISFNRLRLIRLDATLATADDYDNLNDAITAAEAKTLGFDKDEYAPYNNVDGLVALANAKALNQSEENAKADVEALTEALSEATWTANEAEVNAFYDGDFAIQPEHTTGPTALNGWSNSERIRQLIKNTTDYPGLTYASGKAAVFAWGNTSMTYGDTEGYTMPLNAHTIYELSFKTCGWKDGDMGYVSVSVKNANSEGLGDTHSVTATKRINEAESDPWDEFKILFVTGEAGNYTFGMWTSKHTTFTDLKLVKAASQILTIADTDTKANWAPGTYANVTLDRTLSSEYWNTFSVPFNMDKPAEWDVKEFDSADENVITFKDAETIVAGKPYLVKPATDVENPSYENVIVESTEGETMGDGEYKFAAQIYNKPLATDGTIAYLSTDGTIKKLTSGGIKGLRAYFIIPAGGSGARISFGGEETGIQSMEAQNASNNAIYDMQGRKVNNMKKGIYVVNGKKVIK